MMTADQTRRIEALVETLRARPRDAWFARLEVECDDDADVRAEVLRRLNEAHKQGSDTTAAVTDPWRTSRKQPAAPPGEARVGAQMGPYRLLERIGEGGMGTVFLAEQTSPVRRRVALKLIKLGMDTREVVARFESERQALALMSHPNIARVLDAGATPDGRPFFAMEYVPGVPITEYCDKHRLNVRDRLALFIQVCNAVQHAHTKAIIHRDIKPGNILVMLQDGKPTPKVIDFGVAKATDQRLTEHTVFTQHGLMIGTPEYMSPEQAEMSQLDIDTRTDIYSLGVLLYELLTGSLPFERDTLRNAAFAEIQRIIREDEPPRPSARLSSRSGRRRGSRVAANAGAVGDAEFIARIAAQRGSDAAVLIRHLRGDLDWVVMRCLEKDRSLRYDTANALIQDVTRILSDQPTEAGPRSFSRRFGNLIKKNESGIALVLLLLGLLLTPIISIYAVNSWDVEDDLLRVDIPARAYGLVIPIMLMTVGVHLFVLRIMKIVTPLVARYGVPVVCCASGSVIATVIFKTLDTRLSPVQDVLINCAAMVPLHTGIIMLAYRITVLRAFLLYGISAAIPIGLWWGIMLSWALPLGVLVNPKQAPSDVSPTKTAYSKFQEPRDQPRFAVWLDGEPAEAGPVYRVSQSVSVAPTFRFSCLQPGRTGKIYDASLTIFATDGPTRYVILSSKTTRIMPKTRYDLGASPPVLTVVDPLGGAGAGVKLESGMTYGITVAIRADDSENITVMFTTK